MKIEVFVGQKNIPEAIETAKEMKAKLDAMTDEEFKELAKKHLMEFTYIVSTRKEFIDNYVTMRVPANDADWDDDIDYDHPVTFEI